MILPPRANQHTCLAFLRKLDEKLFLALKLGRRQTAFGEKCANLSLKFEVSIVDEIEQQIFRPPANFCLVKKVW